MVNINMQQPQKINNVSIMFWKVRPVYYLLGILVYGN